MSRAKKIAIGLSGGIDSSTAAYLLKKEGWDVVGFTLKITPYENSCCDLESLRAIKKLCRNLGIQHYVLDTTEIFKKEIIDYFIKSYLRGMTPNPCAYCNRLIKFGLFLEKIRSFDIDYLATGHYAKIAEEKGSLYIKKNKDTKKSQEYFLSLVRPEVLKWLVFPLAEYTKKEVKGIAKKNGIIFQDRGESQDVCFARGKDYPDFIQANVTDHDRYHGKIRHIDGTCLGEHKGIYNFTYGQRGGLGISWHKPLYVVDIDVSSNTVVVGEKDRLYKDSFLIQDANWFLDPKGCKDLKVKVRYNSKAFSCDIEKHDDKFKVLLKEKVSAITPGQVASFYSDDLLVGGAIIAKQANAGLMVKSLI